jgi:hypothetical protein
MQARVVELVGAEVTVLGRRLLDARAVPGRQRQHGVAVREQHLAVGHPDRVVPERLGVAEEADLVDVRQTQMPKRMVMTSRGEQCSIVAAWEASCHA